MAHYRLTSPPGCNPSVAKWVYTVCNYSPCSHLLYIQMIDDARLVVFQLFIYTAKGGSLNKVLMFRETLLFFAPQHTVFLLERIQWWGFPDPSLHPFWSPFMTHKEYSGSILAALTARLIYLYTQLISLLKLYMWNKASTHMHTSTCNSLHLCM